MIDLEFIESWEEDDREIEHYKYKGYDIFFNLYGEFEATIDDYWYESIEKACEKVIDQGIRTGEIWTEGCTKVGTVGMGDAIIAALD